MRYQWDEDKDMANRRKHKLSLNAGVPVFDDPYRIETYDGREFYGEDRYITIGLDLDSDTLCVCYTMRGLDDITRIISVRKAKSREKWLYFQQNRG